MYFMYLTIVKMVWKMYNFCMKHPVEKCTLLKTNIFKKRLSLPFYYLLSFAFAFEHIDNNWNSLGNSFPTWKGKNPFSNFSCLFTNVCTSNQNAYISKCCRPVRNIWVDIHSQSPYDHERRHAELLLKWFFRQLRCVGLH